MAHEPRVASITPMTNRPDRGVNRLVGAGFVAVLFLLPLMHDSGIHDQTELPKRVLSWLGVVVLWCVWLIGHDVRRASVTTLRLPLPLTLLAAHQMWNWGLLPFALSPTLSLGPLLRGLEDLLWFALACQLVTLPGFSRAVHRFLMAAAAGVVIVGLAQYGVLHPDAFPLAAPAATSWLASWADGRILGGLFAELRQTDAPGSVFGHTNVAAEFVVMPTLLAIFGGLGALASGWRDDRPRRLVAGFALLAVAALLALFLVRSGSRSAWLGVAFPGLVAVVVSVGFVAWRRPADGSRPRRLILLVAAILAAALAARVALGALESEPRFGQPSISAWQRLLSAFDPRNTTVRERLDLWANTVEMARHYPVFGVGPGNFAAAYPEWSRTRRLHELGRLTASRQPESSHSTWLDMASESGVIGLLTFVGCLATVLMAGLRRGFSKSETPDDRRDALAVVAALTGLTVCATFAFPLWYSASRVTFWTLAALLLGDRAGRPCREIRLSGPAVGGVCLVLVAFGALGAAWSRAQYEASAALERAYRPRDLPAPEPREESTVLTRLRALDQAATRVPVSYVIELLRGEALRSMGLSNEASRAFSRALRLHPHLVNAYVGLGAILLENGRDAAAESALAEAWRLNPSEPRVHLDMAMLRLRQGRTMEARDRFLKALECEPDGPSRLRVHVGLADLFHDSGDTAAAAAHMDKAVALGPDEPLTIEGLARLREKSAPGAEATIEAWRRVLQVLPMHAEAHLRLGLVAWGAENVELAMSHFESAWASDPRMNVALYHRATCLIRFDRLLEARDSLFECMKGCARTLTDRELWDRCRFLVAQVEERLAATPTDAR